MLAQCLRVDEAKAIRDKAEAIKAYLRQQNASRESQNDAAEIKLRAERRLGELTAEQEKAKGAKGIGTAAGVRSQRATTPVPTYAEQGFTKQQAARWQDVAKIPGPKFEAFIREQRDAPTGEITTAGLRREHLGDVKRQERMENLAEIAKGNAPLPIGQTGERYPVIYADPPWRYEHVETESRAIENQYPTMELDAICDLEVYKLATPDAVLFLWATSPKLAEAMRVVEEWGFQYRTSIVWVKDKIGMGYYARQRHELLLIATRGSPPTPAPANRPDSVVEASRGKHSAKPDEFAAAIERMYPGLPKLEMFCRSPRDGWSAWGNQAA